MGTKIRCALIVLTLVLANALCAHAQLRPEVTPKAKKPAPAKPAKPPAPKPQAEKGPEPAQIVVETSPNAEVYLDDQFAGRASPEGRLVIGNPKAGEHALRVSLAGKKDFAQKVTVVAGQVTRIAAALADLLGRILVADLPGRILIHSSAGAEVFLDSASRGRTDASGELALANVPRGAHELWISAPGKKEYRQNITVPAGQEAKIDAPLADLGPAPAPGRVRENPKDGLKYVWVPPGTFMMGCSPGDSECDADEKPSHQVKITKGFWLGQTEVTVAAYKRFVAATGRQMPDAPDFNSGWANDAMPIVNVMWDNAQSYCQWAGGRLPTEAEWEYAARGGSTQARYGNLDEIAWYDKNSGGQTHEVAQKRANGFGLFDVLGNVWEWVNDWYDEKYYQSSPSQDPAGPASGQYRVLRGGSWDGDPRYVRVSDRSRYYPVVRYSYFGFRCLREVNLP